MTQPALIAGCGVEGCGDALYLKGYCCKHYARLRRHGDPLGGGAFLTKRGEPQRFLNEDVVPFTGEDCLLWPYGRQGDGYGIIKSQLVHRIVCAAVHGPAPSARHEAAHSCGKGHLGCVNPQHVRWATPSENQADKIIHGTLPVGEAVPRAKLSNEQVRAVRALPPKYDRRAVAASYGVHPNTISQARCGHKWSHIEGALGGRF